MRLNIGNTYKDNERNLMIDFLDTYALPGFKNGNETWDIGEMVEIILNPGCDQQCEYCYMYRHGKELYPMERRVKSKEEYITNLKVLLKTFEEKKIHITRWEIFGGDLFHNGVFFDILEVFHEYYTRLFPELEYLVPEYNNMLSEIIVPNNLSYLQNDEVYNKILYFYDRLKTDCKVTIGFSYSTDGKYCVNTREKKEIDDAWWDRQFERCAVLKTGYHPMIAPDNIQHWIKNYDWWIEMYKKHHLDVEGNFQPAMLEVRNDGWTDEKIEQYLHFLKHLFVRRFEMLDNDVEKFAYHYFVGDDKRLGIPPRANMDPIMIYPDANAYKLERATCSVQDTIHFDLADLSIVPCHRTAYEMFRAGKCIVEDGVIVDFEPHNVSTYLAVHTHSIHYTPGCIKCVHNDACSKGCYGAQYEYSSELFLPIPSVCNLFKAKHNFILQVLNETGVLQKAFDCGYIPSDQKEYYLRLSKTLGYKLHE